jgi:hypothetical protein
MAFDNISLSEKQSSENEGEVKKRQISFYYKKSRGVHTNSQNLSVFGSNAASRAVMREKKKRVFKFHVARQKNFCKNSNYPRIRVYFKRVPANGARVSSLSRVCRGTWSVRNILSSVRNISSSVRNISWSVGNISSSVSNIFLPRASKMFFPGPRLSRMRARTKIENARSLRENILGAVLRT